MWLSNFFQTKRWTFLYTYSGNTAAGYHVDGNEYLGLPFFCKSLFFFFFKSSDPYFFCIDMSTLWMKVLFFFFFPVSFLFFLNSVIQRSLQELEGCHLKNRMLSSAICKGIQYLLLSRNIRVIRNLGNFCVRGSPHLSKRQK